MTSGNPIRLTVDLLIDPDYDDISIANNCLEMMEKYVSREFPRRVKILDLNYDYQSIQDDYSPEDFEIEGSTKIKASSRSAAKPVSFKLEKPALRSYRFKGTVMEDKDMFQGTIEKVSPYDDAEYWWARIGWNGADLNESVDLIYNGKVQERIYLKSYLDDEGEDNYEDIYEYMDEAIETIAEKLKAKNAKIEPRMVHN